MIVFLIAVAFAFYRSSSGFVWDDSHHLTTNAFDVDQPLSISKEGILKRIVVDSFGSVTRSGYRPLSAAIDLLGVSLFTTSRKFALAWFVGVGVVVGLLSVAVYAVASRYVRTKTAAALAVFLFLCSSPVVSGSWIVFAGIQAIVPLIVCSELLLYWKITSTSRFRRVCIVLLCLLYLVGPWFREFIGMTALMIVFLELRSHKRLTILTCISAAFFLHALYPTALVHLFFFEDLPLGSIFSLGSLGDQMASTATSSGWIRNTMRSLRWQAGAHYLTLFGPLLLFLLLLDYIVYALIQLRQETTARLSLDRTPAIVRTPAATFARLLPTAYLTVLILGMSEVYSAKVLWLVLVLLFAFQALRQDVFLAIWFLLFFLPFLRVFTEQVHLAYCMLPASIIAAGTIERMYFGLSLDRQCRLIRCLRYGLCAIVLISGIDHGLNVYGSHRVVNGVYDGTVAAAKWLRKNVPENSIVVANAIHCEDMRFFCNDWIEIYYTVRAGLARPESGEMIDPNNLQRLLEQSLPQRKVYFLELDFDYTPNKVKYHSHKYVRAGAVKMRDLGIIHTTQISYPFLDPFKAWIPREYVSFLGPPDLENDFYRGPSRTGRPFVREVYADYHLYEVVGEEVNMP